MLVEITEMPEHGQVEIHYATKEDKASSIGFWVSPTTVSLSERNTKCTVKVAKANLMDQCHTSCFHYISITLKSI